MNPTSPSEGKAYPVHLATCLTRRIQLAHQDYGIIVDIPEGYRLVKNRIEAGDKFLSRDHLPEIVFTPVDFVPNDEEFAKDVRYATAGWFSLVIRPIRDHHQDAG